MRSLLAALVPPQTEPLAGQVPNSAGGWSYPLPDRARLDRFLVLGTEGGSYYAAERTLTVENAQVVLRCLAEDGPGTVARVVAISSAGRAPKNDPAIFALALALKRGDLATRRAAAAAVPAVCRTGTHLFALAQAVDALGGWGRGTKRAFASWYLDKSPRDLGFQLVKYPSRGGWSHRDVLRLAKPAGATGATDALLRYATRAVVPEGGFAALDSSLALLDAAEAARTADVPALIQLIHSARLPWEVLPTPRLRSTEVWRALVEARAVPYTALLRNLGRLSGNGVLVAGAPAVQLVLDRLRDPAAIRGARVHPLAVLGALVTYRSGHGARGDGKWTPVPSVVAALETAFYASFANAPTTGKRWLLALDVSGSMGMGTLAGYPGLSPRVGSAAMALVTARNEPACTVVAFTAAAKGTGGRWGGGTPGLTNVPLEHHTLETLVAATAALPMGGTDCALPMLHAEKHRIPVDVFAVYTDSETWAGPVHPVEALRRYRRTMKIPAKLVVIGMVSNGFSIADPSDAGMLDVVGFDAGAPAAMAAFAEE